MTKELIVIFIGIIAAYLGGIITGEKSVKKTLQESIELGKQINESWGNQCLKQNKHWADMCKLREEKIKDLERQLAEREHPADEGWNTK